MYSLRSMWDRYLGSLWSSMVGIVPHSHWLKTVQNSLLGIRMLKVHCVVVIWNKKWRKKNTTAQRLFLGYVSLDYKHQWLIYQAFGQTHISTGDPVGAKNKQTNKQRKQKKRIKSVQLRQEIQDCKCPHPPAAKWAENPTWHQTVQVWKSLVSLFTTGPRPKNLLRNWRLQLCDM